MGAYVTGAELRAKASSLRDAAGHYDRRLPLFADNVAAAGTIVDTARANWVGPRADHDLLIVCGYLAKVRPMVLAIGDVAAKLRAFADDADRLAGYLEGYKATLAQARAETPPGEALPYEAWLAQRGIEALSSDWDLARARHALYVTAASTPLEAAHRAFVSGFSAPVVTGTEYLTALVNLAAAAGVDLALLGYPDAKAVVRAGFEEGYGDLEGHELVIAVMTDTSEADAATYWHILTADERRALVATRPDLAAKALDGGGKLTDADLRQLKSSNAYPQFTETFEVAVQGSVGLRLVSVSTYGEWSVVAMMMSDGRVQVAVVRALGAGVGVEADDSANDAEAFVGVFTSGEAVFVFPDEESAAAAIEKLKTESRNIFVNLFLEGVDVLAGPAINIDSELESELKGLWVPYGMVRTSATGVYGNVEVEVEEALGELELEGDVSVAVYDTDTTELADEPARKGIIVAGSLHLNVEADSATATAGPSKGASPRPRRRRARSPSTPTPTQTATNS